jgi:hypothetical protein
MDEKKSSPVMTAEAVILTKPGHGISRRNIDPDALKILFRLHSLRFTAYLTGGAVRDMMLGKAPKDFDIVTDARPGQIKKYFSNVFIIGRRFRLAHIHFKGGKIIEVATFRKNSSLGRHDTQKAGKDTENISGVPGRMLSAGTSRSTLCFMMRSPPPSSIMSEDSLICAIKKSVLSATRGSVSVKTLSVFGG